MSVDLFRFAVEFAILFDPNHLKDSIDSVTLSLTFDSPYHALR